MTPIRIQVLFHWGSDSARRLAAHLYATFSARPLGDGPRMPVRFGPRQANEAPPPLKLDADHELIVILIDERMARRARESDRAVADKWGQLVADLLANYPPKSGSSHRILPVALDTAALQLAPSLSQTSFVRLDARQGQEKERHLTLHVAVQALRILQDLPNVGARPIDELPDIPVSLFISHAKKDLPGEDEGLSAGPVKALLAALSQLPVRGWYDSAQIPPGGRFPDEIEKGVLNSSALIVVLTDSWSSRDWCRREVLEAKLVARPLVVVDALESRVVRLFPYLGNALTLRWRAAIGFQDDSFSGSLSCWEREDAAAVIEAALLEAIRSQHERRRLQHFIGPKEIALNAPPEALTLANLPSGITRIWYPDPPLGREELMRLMDSGAPEPTAPIRMTTPLSELANWLRPLNLKAVAISLSNASDTDQYGGSPEHLATLADDLLLYLLIAGLRIAYGGVLGHQGVRTSAVASDEINYVDRLLSTVRSHSTLLYNVIREAPAPIENWVAWPLHLSFGEQELRVYGQEARLRDLPPPEDLNVTELFPASHGVETPATPSNRYALARSLTYMRESMLAEVSARIAVGGKLSGYQGLWPGVLEEGVMSLRAGQPLFLLGAFGGAARLMIDALRGLPREELTNGWFCKQDGLDELRNSYQLHGRVVQAPEELAAELKAFGVAGLAAALKNGLSDEENNVLIDAEDSLCIVSLILKGLQRQMLDKE